MASKIAQKLGSWITRQIIVSRPEGKCVRLVLHHIPPTGKLGSEIARANVAKSEALTDEIMDSYARDLFEEAESYAEGVGQTQTFAVVSYFESDEEKGLARHAFTVNVDNENSPDSIVASEPGDLTGAFKQQMRHNEAILRSTMAFFGTALGTLQKQNDTLGRMVEKMFNDKVEQIEAVESLVSSNHQREIEMRREEFSNETKRQMTDNFIALLPAIANKIVGKKILPETTDISLQALVNLSRALTPQEVEEMLKSLPPEKQIALVELLQSVQARTEGNGKSS